MLLATMRHCCDCDFASWASETGGAEPSVILLFERGDKAHEQSLQAILGLVAPYRAILRYFRCDSPYRAILLLGPFFATYHAIIARYATKKTSTKEFCDTIAASIAQFEKDRFWASTILGCLEDPSDDCYSSGSEFGAVSQFRDT